ncbi:MAG: hypothetical protein HY691_12810 [Chloroflexi bacterium]|nr:hypothetical protein [Chloroflexota bacterium]
MKTYEGLARRRLPSAVLAPIFVGLLALLAACDVGPRVESAAPALQPAAPPAAAGAAVAPSAQSAAPAATPAAAKPAPQAPLKLLKVAPVDGHIGDSFTIAGEGLPANAQVQFFWATMDGTFDTKVHLETVEFYERKFAAKRIPLGRATTDAQGAMSARLTVPDDYGEIHDIYAAVDGQDVARGGYRVLPEFSVSPLEGPIGTPIVIRARGLGWKNWESTWAVSWDNKYAGFISAVTTRGTAVAVVRAAGPIGKRMIDIWHAGQTVPYLNWEQSPQAHIPIFQYTFNVTKDAGPPQAAVEWPEGAVPAIDPVAPRTTANVSALSRAVQIGATIAPPAGPILSRATLRGTALPPNAPVELFWMTARGSRTSGLGWALAELPLGKAVTDQAGVLALDFQVPDDLGGWHTVKVVQGDKILAEVPYLIQPSLVGVTPTRVKVGETFKVQIKGVGWTELDNIYTVVYDNSYVGFACGFNSNGDVTVNLRASGVPGTHLVDLYPAIYQGHGKPPWLYDTPQLTALRDHPGLALGYRLPIFRLAIEVIE